MGNGLRSRKTVIILSGTFLNGRSSPPFSMVSASARSASKYKERSQNLAKRDFAHL